MLGLGRPHTLSGSGAWALVVLAVLYGLGWGVRRLLRIDLLIGEQLAAGAIAWIFVGGALLSAGVASRIPLFALAGAGFVLALVAIVQHGLPVRMPEGTREERWARIALGLVLAGFLVFYALAMVGTRGNPYDDHVAYTAFVKRVLDVGDLVEPFSFRRLSAYGGQTVLLALAGLRGDVYATDLLDRGVFQIIAVLLVLDVLRRRCAHVAVATAVIVFLLCLWDLSINSAATWTGFVMFTAAYAFATRDDLEPRTSLVLAFAACASACTLRQNYLLPAGLFALLLLWFHLRARASESSWKAAWTNERHTILVALAVVGLIVLPYAIATWHSNRTFLYPIVPGTWNPSAPLRPSGSTIYDELTFFVAVLLRSDPLRIWWLLVPIMFLARDVRERRPLRAFVIANCVGFAYLIHSFTLSDTNTLWRYGFGYMTPLAIMFIIEIASVLPVVGSESSGSKVMLPKVAAFLVWLAVVAQTVLARDVPSAKLVWATENVKAALKLGTHALQERVGFYERMQASIPPGSRVAVMLDEPYLLDYSRNEIFNLDLPGFSAPGPGLPSFTTPLHWRAYFKSLGIRYVAFVGGERSSYLYRRAGWLWRIYADDELWRYMGAHMVDTIDTLHALAESGTLVFHEGGIYVVDIGTLREHEPDRGPDELTRMDAFARRISEEELGTKAWSVASRRNVIFLADSLGPSAVVPMPTDEDVGIWGRLFGVSEPKTHHRWLMDRTHIRVRGERKQQLRVKVWVSQRRLFTTPSLSLTLDGKTVARGEPDASGVVTLEAVTSCTGWCDVYLLSSTISEFWRAPDDLKALKLLELDWTEVP